MLAAVRSTCPSGTTMLRTKYRPDATVKPRMTTITTMLMRKTLFSWFWMRVRLVTSRMAATSSAA